MTTATATLTVKQPQVHEIFAKLEEHKQTKPSQPVQTVAVQMPASNSQKIEAAKKAIAEYFVLALFVSPFILLLCMMLLACKVNMGMILRLAPIFGAVICVAPAILSSAPRRPQN